MDILLVSNPIFSEAFMLIGIIIIDLSIKFIDIFYTHRKYYIYLSNDFIIHNKMSK